ncbi:MAG: ATP-dependent sacrificial sulfur transferase LarE [Lentisphaerae bacterium]|nr:ATP-dependent sacrificial sulfur transferase LarE [Lentisphaerota bacterium]
MKKLHGHLKRLQSVLVAFSAGVDSTLLAVLANAVLADKALAVTAVSPSLPQSDRLAASVLAEKYGLRHCFIESDEMSDERFTANSPDRCYYCKGHLFRELRRMADERGLVALLDGSNVDDADDFRPGRRAAAELGVISPLAAAGMHKSDIRVVSRLLGLPTANKPAMACLASRIPYGLPLTGKILRQVDAAEDSLRKLGFTQVRVRSHGDVARLELPENELAAALPEPVRTSIVRELKNLGYRYITLDLVGYRTGSMNEALTSANAGL